jgi:methylated-DNA-protein-cysteine methyltransferase-like protein
MTDKTNQPLVKEKKSLDRNGFFSDVFDVVRLVPEGRVTTYGAIAAYLGTRLSARMVGWAMNASHAVQPPVPAQRVVNRNGMLSGRMHFETPSEMQELLEKEGVNVKDNMVQDFHRLFWDPTIEMTL